MSYFRIVLNTEEVFHSKLTKSFRKRALALCSLFTPSHFHSLIYVLGN